MNKYKIGLLLLAFTLFISGINQAQTGSISGIISVDGEVMPGVSISIPALTTGASSTETGSYSIKNIAAGEHILKVSFIGFTTIEKSIEITDSEEIVMNFSMQEDAIELEGALISAFKNRFKNHHSTIISNTISNKTYEITQSLSISEGLNFSPGLRVENNCQNCGFNQLRMNGLEGSYSQILVNNRPIFSSLAGVYGLEMLPANMVEKVEVVRGGGSALNGGSAIGGTVNIITKDPIENSFEIGINQAFTNFETIDRTISMNGSIVSDDLDKGLTVFAYNRSRNPWDANDDGFSEITKLRNNTFGFDSFYNISKRSKLKLGLYAIHEYRRGGNKFDLKPHQTDITEELTHRILNSNLSFEQFSEDLKHKVSIYASAQFVNRDSYYGTGGRVLTASDTILTAQDLLAINAYGTARDISAVGGLQYHFEINKKLNLTSGIEYQFNDVNDILPGYDRLVDQTVKTLGSYAQLEIKPIDKITFLLGGRYDYVDITGIYELGENRLGENRDFNILVPRVSALYAPRKDLKFRLSYAQGYRAPQSFDEDLHIESVGGDVRFTILSPDLQIESSNSLTASVNYSKVFKKVQMNFVAEGFYNQLKNPFIISDQTALANGTSVLVRRNGSGATVQGVNLEANFSYTEKLVFQSGLTLQSALYSSPESIWTPEDENDSAPATFTNRILRTPNVYGYLTLSYNPVEPFILSYSGVFTGRMDVTHVIDIDTEQTIIEETPTFFENNIKLTYILKLNENYNLHFFAGMQNILNSFQSNFDTGINRDADFIFGPTRPRTIFVGSKLSLN